MSVTSELSTVLAELDDMRERIAALLIQAGETDGGWSESRAVRIRVLKDWRQRFLKQLSALCLPTGVKHCLDRYAYVRSTEWDDEKKCAVPCWPQIGFGSEEDCIFVVDGRLLDFPEWADWVCSLDDPHEQLQVRNLGRTGWAKFRTAWEKASHED